MNNTSDDNIFIEWSQDVVDFHVKYGIQYNGPPRTLPTDILKFRVARDQEELKEYVDAAYAGQLPEQLDAKIDQIYIALGTLHLQGFKPEIIAEAWRRVHNANMSKELASAKNPGKHGNKQDIVKPVGWVAPDHTDLCQS